MFAFDWELKDINNKSHPPGKHELSIILSFRNFDLLKCLCVVHMYTDREVTPIVVWFYINMLYFPYNAQDLAKVSYEDFSKPIFESLERVADILAEDVQHP